MYYITQNKDGLITGRYTSDIHGDNIPADAIEVAEEVFNTSIQMQRPAFIDNKLVELPPDLPTQDQLTQQAKFAVYALLDQTAQQYDYRDFAEVAQFVNSNAWKAEADGLLAWQDTVWLKTYDLLKNPVTSVDNFLAQLPKYIPLGWA